jgi:hypothetical protein
MTTRFAAARRSSLMAYRAAFLAGGLFGAFALLAPQVAAQDVGIEVCGVVCQIVTEGGDDSLIVAPPPGPELVGPNHLDDSYAAPAPPPPGPPDPSVDPYSVDTDGDGVPDGYEGLDSDYDGVWDWYEIYVYGTDPYTADQPTRSGGGAEMIPPDESSEEDCTYATPDTCFPRVKPDDDTPE